MTHKKHLILIAAACMAISVEQLIFGALKTNNNGTKRLEAVTKKPTLNERLTQLENKFSALDGRVAQLEGNTGKAPAVEISQTETVTETPVLENLDTTLASDTLMSDPVTSTTPAQDMLVSLTPSQPTLSSEQSAPTMGDMMASTTPALTETETVAQNFASDTQESAPLMSIEDIAASLSSVPNSLEDAPVPQ